MTPRPTISSKGVMRCAAILFLLVLASAQAQVKPGAAKKGVSGGIAVARAFKSAWYYNWGPKGESEPGIEFIPMVKGKWHVNDATLAAIKASGAKTLLTFNEPERAEQGNVTVDEALDLWRAQVLKDGMKLRRNEKREGWVSGKFLHPHDACFDASGNIFVAEWVNTGRITRLRKVS